MKLLADENFPTASVLFLRECGHDVSSVADTMPGASDTAVLASARENDQVLLTFDGDFGALVFQDLDPPPPGIVFLRFIPRNPTDAGIVVDELLAREDLEVFGCLTVVDAERVRQRKLPEDQRT